MNNYVIIGGGIASLGCIEALKNTEKNANITLISNENYLPYARPLISYYLEDRTTPEKMQYRDKELYDDIDVKLGVSATNIDKKSVLLDNGETVKFDKLLVATGSRPFIPPFKGLETVEKKFSFMTLDDAFEIEKNITKKSKVLIIGAGLIGLKCAEGLFNKVASISVCDLADRVLSSIIDKECSEKIEKKLTEKGIELILSDSVEVFNKNKATFNSGKEIEFDVLITAVGVRPNIDMLKEIGADINRGVIVNDYMETSVKNIYAAGDICEGNDISSGTKKVMAVLPNAYMEGYTAGCNMSGKKQAYDNQIPLNSIGFFGYHLMTTGSYDGECYTEIDEETIKKLYVKDNRLIGFMMLGNVAKAGIYTNLVKCKTPLNTIDYETLKANPSLLSFSLEYRKEKLGGILQ